MRTVTTTVEAAIEDVGSSKMRVKATVQPSRVYFGSLTDNDPFEAGDFSAITDTPRPQAMCYSNTNSGAVTFIVDDSGDINAMVQGSGSGTDTGANTETDCKPGVWDLGTGSAELWYWEGSNVKKATVNMTTLTAGSPTSYSPNPTEFTIDKGSCHPVSSTEVVFVYKTSIGGASVAYYNGSSWSYWDRRFMSPNRLTDNGYWTVYSAAAKFNSDIYVYMTDMDTGEVRAVHYDVSADRWSDSFIAVPADLSRFCVGNARVVNGYVHLSGQFHRTEDWTEAQKWSLILRSTDGRTFSWDRHTGLSILGYQFQFDVDGTGDTLYASDRNCVGESTLSHYFTSAPATQVVLQPPNDIVEFTTSSHSRATMTLRAADETLIDSPIITRGSKILVQIGYHTTAAGGSVEYTDYNTYFIDGVTEDFADGKRGLGISLTQEGVWKTSQIAFPFYAEIISKSTSIDDMDKRDKSHTAPGVAQTTDDLVLDFWPNEAYENSGESITGKACITANGVGCELQTGRYDINTDTWGWLRGDYKWGFQTVEIKDQIGASANPEITATSISVKFYGWCCTGQSARANDTYELRIVTTDEDGAETERTGTLVGSPGVGNRFPQHHPDTESGSYPVQYNFTSLTIGHRLKHVRIIVENTDSTEYNYSEFCPERLEITDLKYPIPGMNPRLTWLQTKPSTYGITDDTIMEVPGMGVPYVMFLTRPYTAYNYAVAADFVHEAGDNPATTGTIAWGAVGTAEDGSNFIVARMNLTNDKIELVMYRDGETTVLTDYSTGGTDADKLMLEHKDGEFMVRPAWPSTPDEWEAAVIAYQFDEVTQGILSTSDSDIMKLGFYGLKDTPKFRIASFNVGDADGVGMIVQSDASVINTFPSSGKCVIDGITYSYTARTLIAEGVGPYQLRNSFDYGSKTYDSVRFSGLACEIAYFQDHDTNIYKYGNYLFSSDIGHSWKVSKTLWEVIHSTGGVPVPLNQRSRWHGENFNDNWFGTDNRIFVGPGLLGLTMDESSEQGSHHPYGTWCFMAASNRLWCKSAFATTADTSTSVQDMVDYLCRVASVEAEFPGDWTDDTENITSTPYQLASTDTLMPGGYDVQFTIPALTSGHYVGVYASNVYVGDEDSTEDIDVRIRNNSGTLEIAAVPKDAIADPQYYPCDSNFSTSDSHVVRVFAHQSFISVYLDGIWVTTFAWHEDTIHWPKIDPVDLYMYTNGSYTVTSIKVVELFDWREAIYFESEMSAQSAIASVIQERPVEIIPKSNGGLFFTYHLKRDTITYSSTHSKNIIKRHRYTEAFNMDAGSDAIVYYADVAFVSDPDFAASDGFFTKVLKLSSLDTGAKGAAQLLLEKANENQFQHTLEMRPDIRVEPGDVIDITYVITGTGTNVNHTMIVNDVGIRIREGTYEMTSSGRKDI
jgi:hypothetical protein